MTERSATDLAVWNWLVPENKRDHSEHSVKVPEKNNTITFSWKRNKLSVRTCESLGVILLHKLCTEATPSPDVVRWVASKVGSLSYSCTVQCDTPLHNRRLQLRTVTGDDERTPEHLWLRDQATYEHYDFLHPDKKLEDLCEFFRTLHLDDDFTVHAGGGCVMVRCDTDTPLRYASGEVCLSIDTRHFSRLVSAMLIQTCRLDAAKASELWDNEHFARIVYQLVEKVGGTSYGWSDGDLTTHFERGHIRVTHNGKTRLLSRDGTPWVGEQQGAAQEVKEVMSTKEQQIQEAWAWLFPNEQGSTQAQLKIHPKAGPPQTIELQRNAEGITLVGVADPVKMEGVGMHALWRLMREAPPSVAVLQWVRGWVDSLGGSKTYCRENRQLMASSDSLHMQLSVGGYFAKYDLLSPDPMREELCSFFRSLPVSDGLEVCAGAGVVQVRRGDSTQLLWSSPGNLIAERTITLGPDIFAHLSKLPVEEITRLWSNPLIRECTLQTHPQQGADTSAYAMEYDAATNTFGRILLRDGYGAPTKLTLHANGNVELPRNALAQQVWDWLVPAADRGETRCRIRADGDDHITLKWKGGDLFLERNNPENGKDIRYCESEDLGIYLAHKLTSEPPPSEELLHWAHGRVAALAGRHTCARPTDLTQDRVELVAAKEGSFELRHYTGSEKLYDFLNPDPKLVHLVELFRSLAPDWPHLKVQAEAGQVRIQDAEGEHVLRVLGGKLREGDASILRLFLKAVSHLPVDQLAKHWENPVLRELVKQLMSRPRQLSASFARILGENSEFIGFLLSGEENPRLLSEDKSSHVRLTFAGECIAKAAVEPKPEPVASDSLANEVWTWLVPEECREVTQYTLLHGDRSYDLARPGNNKLHINGVSFREEFLPDSREAFCLMLHERLRTKALPSKAVLSWVKKLVKGLSHSYTYSSHYGGIRSRLKVREDALFVCAENGSVSNYDLLNPSPAFEELAAFLRDKVPAITNAAGGGAITLRWHEEQVTLIGDELEKSQAELPAIERALYTALITQLSEDRLKQFWSTNPVLRNLVGLLAKQTAPAGEVPPPRTADYDHPDTGKEKDLGVLTTYTKGGNLKSLWLGCLSTNKTLQLKAGGTVTSAVFHRTTEDLWSWLVPEEHREGNTFSQGDWTLTRDQGGVRASYGVRKEGTLNPTEQFGQHLHTLLMTKAIPSRAVLDWANDTVSRLSSNQSHNQGLKHYGTFLWAYTSKPSLRAHGASYDFYKPDAAFEETAEFLRKHVAGVEAGGGLVGIPTEEGTVFYQHVPMTKSGSATELQQARRKLFTALDAAPEAELLHLWRSTDSALLKFITSMCPVSTETELLRSYGPLSVRINYEEKKVSRIRIHNEDSNRTLELLANGTASSVTSAQPVTVPAVQNEVWAWLARCTGQEESATVLSILGDKDKITCVRSADGTSVQLLLNGNPDVSGRREGIGEQLTRFLVKNPTPSRAVNTWVRDYVKTLLGHYTYTVWGNLTDIGFQLSVEDDVLHARTMRSLECSAPYLREENDPFLARMRAFSEWFHADDPGIDTTFNLLDAHNSTKWHFRAVGQAFALLVHERSAILVSPAGVSLGVNVSTSAAHALLHKLANNLLDYQEQNNGENPPGAVDLEGQQLLTLLQKRLKGSSQGWIKNGAARSWAVDENNNLTITRVDPQGVKAITAFNATGVPVVGVSSAMAEVDTRAVGYPWDVLGSHYAPFHNEAKRDPQDVTLAKEVAGWLNKFLSHSRVRVTTYEGHAGCAVRINYVNENGKEVRGKLFQVVRSGDTLHVTRKHDYGALPLSEVLVMALQSNNAEKILSDERPADARVFTAVESILEYCAVSPETSLENSRPALRQVHGKLVSITRQSDDRLALRALNPQQELLGWTRMGGLAKYAPRASTFLGKPFPEAELHGRLPEYWELVKNRNTHPLLAVLEWMPDTLKRTLHCNDGTWVLQLSSDDHTWEVGTEPKTEGEKEVMCRVYEHILLLLNDYVRRFSREPLAVILSKRHPCLYAMLHALSRRLGNDQPVNLKEQLLTKPGVLLALESKGLAFFWRDGDSLRGQILAAPEGPIEGSWFAEMRLRDAGKTWPHYYVSNDGLINFGEGTFRGLAEGALAVSAANLEGVKKLEVETSPAVAAISALTQEQLAALAGVPLSGTTGFTELAASMDEQFLAHVRSITPVQGEITLTAEEAQSFLARMGITGPVGSATTDGEPPMTTNDKIATPAKPSLMEHPLVKSAQADATEAAWRTAGNQLVKLTRDPLVGLMSRHLGPDDESLRKKIADFLATEAGTAMLSGLLSVALLALPTAMSNPATGKLSRELRVKAMADMGDVVADLLMGPLRDVMALYLQGIPTPPMPEELPQLGEGTPSATQQLAGDAGNIINAESTTH